MRAHTRTKHSAPTQQHSKRTNLQRHVVAPRAGPRHRVHVLLKTQRQRHKGAVALRLRAQLRDDSAAHVQVVLLAAVQLVAERAELFFICFVGGGGVGFF